MQPAFITFVLCCTLALALAKDSILEPVFQWGMIQFQIPGKYLNQEVKFKVSLYFLLTPIMTALTLKLSIVFYLNLL